ncbi:MAG: glycine-rich protein, partial [Chthoniobacterales bacterium]
MRPISLSALAKPALLLAALTLPLAAHATTQTFSYTGGAQSWPVPAGVTAVTVTASGAQGGLTNNGVTGHSGGLGGITTATFTVSAGETLAIYVGQAGTPRNQVAAGGTGGFNGGGTGGTAASFGGGGGGGASDVRQGGSGIGNRVVIAGGGGGAGGNGHGGNGANGGGTTGQTGGSGDIATGGGGGTQIAGGAGGIHAGAGVDGTAGNS